MAKEKQESDLEITNESENSIEVNTEKAEEKMTDETIKSFNPSDLISEFEKEQSKKELPDIYVGDTVKVGVKITEGNKERVQPYEGCYCKRHGGINQTITVGDISGIGVESIYATQSTGYSKVERRGKVRRAKLLSRDRVGKATRKATL